MGRYVSLASEVLRRLHQAPAEVPLPVVVDGHPSGQGVLGTDQPSGQSEAVARLVGRERGQPLWGGRGYRITAIAVVPALQHVSSARARQFSHHHHVFHARLKRCPLGAEPLELRVQLTVPSAGGMRKVVFPEAASSAAAARDIGVGLGRVDVVLWRLWRARQNLLAVDVRG